MRNLKLKRIIAGISALCMTASLIPTVSVVSGSAEESTKLGDVDLDGEVSINDAVLIMSYVGNPQVYPLSSQGMDNGDVYFKGDGISNMDALSIQKLLANILTSLPESYMDIVPNPTTTTAVIATNPIETTTTPDNPQTSITYIHLKNTSVDIDGENAVAEGTKVTISASGEYYIDGTLDDGQIFVNVADEVADPGTVKLFFNGANITGSSAPAIYIENAENTSLNLVEGTENILSDGAEAYAGDYLDNAVIHAKDDITIKGSGTLNINANTQYALHCNNDVKLNGGNINITTAASDAVRGKNSVTVKGGNISIDSAGDGIKSTKGNVTISGGNVVVKASNDAVQAETTIEISGGTVNAGGDRGLTAINGVNITGGTVIATATDNQAEAISASQGTMLLNCLADATTTDGCWKKSNKLTFSSGFKAEFTKKFRYVIISDPSLNTGTQYAITNEGNSTSVTHTNGNSAEFNLSEMVTVFNDVNLAETVIDVPVTGNYTISFSDGAVASNAPSDSVTSNGSICTITKPGVFSLSGTGKEVQIVVDVDKTVYPDGIVELDLEGVDITNTTDSPVYVAAIGDECQIVAKKGYDNIISDGSSYVNADASSGAIYAKDDLKIKGSGNLTVNGNCGDAVVCKNDLKVYDGNITINSVDDGLRGKDSVTIGNSKDVDFSTLNITINSTAGDGIKSSNETEEGQGTITVNGGTINIKAMYDGFQAVTDLTVNGGAIDVYTYEGSNFKGSGSTGSTGGNTGGMGGWGGPGGGGMQDGNQNKVTDSAKGLKSDGTINILGGNITVDSSDDAFHSAGDMNIFGGKLKIASADDAMHSDTILTIGKDTSVPVSEIEIYAYKCYEGVEAMTINQNSGTVYIVSEDDGYNAAGGADGSGNTSNNPWNQGGMGGSMGGNTGLYAINLNGGIVVANSANGDHDAFDSNGSINITGGYYIANGQEAIDADGSITNNGGNVITLRGGNTNLSTTYVFTDANGNVVASALSASGGSYTYSSGSCKAYSGANVSGGINLSTLGEPAIYANGNVSGGAALTAGSGSSGPGQRW